MDIYKHTVIFYTTCMKDGGLVSGDLESWDDMVLLSSSHTTEEGTYEPKKKPTPKKAPVAKKLKRGKLITNNGVSKTLMEWCEIHGISTTTAYYRRSCGKTFDQIFKK